MSLMYRLEARYKKYGPSRESNIKRLVSLDIGGKCYYLRPSDQLVCRHHPKLNKVYDFVKNKSHDVVMNENEFSRFYSIQEERLFIVQGGHRRPMLNEAEFVANNKLPFTDEDRSLFDYHLANCPRCKTRNKPKPTIRKREKLGDSALALAKDIGRGASLRNLGIEYKLSKPSIIAFKKKLNQIPKNGVSAAKIKKPKEFKSLSGVEQRLIEEQVLRNGFAKLSNVRKDLMLDCSPTTVTNFVRSKGYHRCGATEQLLLSQTNLELKQLFSKLIGNLTFDHISCLLFADEKTLESNHTSKLHVYRKRGKNHRNHKRYIFRRNSQNNFKVNLFGYLTPNGVGDLFVFSNQTNSKKFVNYFEFDVLPSILERFGDRFVMVLDNASYHKSKLTLEYFQRINLNLLIWCPQTPDFNVIKNVWSILVKRVNSHFFDHGPVTRREDLIRIAFECWYSIESTIIQKLYQSFLRRLNAFLINLQ